MLASATAITIGGELVVSSWSDASLLVFAAAFLLTAIGLIDDLWQIGAVPRFALQAAAVVLIFVMLPSQARALPVLPIWLERPLLVMGLLWFINLVNFMDGIDWMTVAEMLPVTTALAVFALWGGASPGIVCIELALAGSLIGFAPFNRPVASLFLGDVGSQPIGLLTGWCLLELANRNHLVAALLLPLYYLADATITLLRRFAAGEKIWIPHRSHFYQRATDNGFTALQVVGRVFVLNIVLAGLAAASIATQSSSAQVILFGLGATCVAVVLLQFSRRH
jgi:UDP-N-acetylmuramyl pentapeptide phosphotransferase/UDP-N-acetylglucosamine-1-phosphate transferase